MTDGDALSDQGEGAIRPAWPWWGLAFGSAAGVHVTKVACMLFVATGSEEALVHALDIGAMILWILVLGGSAGLLAVLFQRERFRTAGLATVALAAILGGTQLYGCTVSAQVDPGEVPTRSVDGGEAFDHEQLERVLERFVDEHGMVDYAGLLEERELLDRYVSQLAAASPRSHPDLFPTDDHEIAYWINAYNGLMMRAVIDDYPVDSVTDIMTAHGVFNRLEFPVGGEPMTLDDIEKGVLLVEWEEIPEIHWALTCASMSCPRIDRRAVRAEGLRERLEEEGRAFLDSDRAVVVEPDRNLVRLSMYFEWYRDDFPPDPLTYVRPFLSGERRSRFDALEDPTVEHMAYDWRLNDQAADRAPGN